MCENVRVPPWGLNTNANLYLMLYTGLFKKVHHTGTILWFEQVEINLCHYFITLPELNSLHAGKLYMFLSSADFFRNQRFRKFLSGMLSECQTVWTQIRPDFLLGLIWVQTVCNGYQQEKS